MATQPVQLPCCHAAKLLLAAAAADDRGDCGAGDVFFLLDTGLHLERDRASERASEEPGATSW